MPGRKTLQLTGQIGDVMKESAEAALSYVRSQAERFGINPRFFDRKDIHIHVPAGAVPEGRPLGRNHVNRRTCVHSWTERLVRSDLAMTGEITLRGKVMPVGGVKEKMLGAHRAGISTIILPKRNENDLDDLTKELREELNFRVGRECGRSSRSRFRGGTGKNGRSFGAGRRSRRSEFPCGLPAAHRCMQIGRHPLCFPRVPACAEMTKAGSGNNHIGGNSATRPNLGDS